MLDEIDRLVEAGRAAERAGAREAAIRHYVAATRIDHHCGPARIALSRIADDLFADAIATRDHGDVDGAVALLVRSIELNPAAAGFRAELDRLLGTLPPRRDLTTECLIFPDAARADAFYRSAIRTCLEFVAYGGIGRDVLEFGVLAGWTARRFAETMRDLGYFGDLHLFDSFEGLPHSKHAIDRDCYDVRRGIWRADMKLPDAWVEAIGAPIDVHVAQSLARVISPSRIHVRRGFFAATLGEPLAAKAAVVHLDCDLYQSTAEVLAALERDAVLQDGTVLMFDDWNCNRANPAYGQRRAFREFLEAHAAKYSASPYLNYGFNCAAFILHLNA